MNQQEKTAMAKAADKIEQLTGQVKEATDKVAALEQTVTEQQKELRIFKLAEAMVEGDRILPEHLPSERQRLMSLSDRDLEFEEWGLANGRHLKVAELSRQDEANIDRPKNAAEFQSAFLAETN